MGKRVNYRGLEDDGADGFWVILPPPKTDETDLTDGWNVY